MLASLSLTDHSLIHSPSKVLLPLCIYRLGLSDLGALGSHLLFSFQLIHQIIKVVANVQEQKQHQHSLLQESSQVSSQGSSLDSNQGSTHVSSQSFSSSEQSFQSSQTSSQTSCNHQFQQENTLQSSNFTTQQQQLQQQQTFSTQFQSCSSGSIPNGLIGESDHAMQALTNGTHELTTASAEGKSANSGQYLTNGFAEHATISAQTATDCIHKVTVGGGNVSNNVRQQETRTHQKVKDFRKNSSLIHN